MGYYRLRDGLEESALEPRSLGPSDPTMVFLVGHPKSGNTGSPYMLAVFLSDDREGKVNLYNVGDYVPFVHGHDHAIAAYGHLPDPRVFRNEYPRYPRRYPGTLYLVRDPRAVLVSFRHMFATMFDDRDMTLSRFVDGYLSGTAPFDSWHRHLGRWDRQVGAALRRAERGERMCVVRSRTSWPTARRRCGAWRNFIGAVPAGDVPRERPRVFPGGGARIVRGHARGGGTPRRGGLRRAGSGRRAIHSTGEDGGLEG